MHEAYYADEEDYWSLGNLTDHYDEFDGDSLINVLSGFFEQYSDVDDDDDRKRTFEVNRYEADSNVVEGEIKLGEYGIEADVYDTEEQERIHRHRKAHHSEETPFYFLFYKPPSNDTRAVAVLKQYRARGIMGELYSCLEEYISQYNSDDEDRKDIVCEMKPVYTQDAEERIIRADEFKRLKFEGIQELSPVEEYADNQEVTDAERQTVSRTYEIKPTSESRWTPDFVQSFMPDGTSGIVFALAGFAVVHLPWSHLRVTRVEWFAAFIGVVALLQVIADPLTGPYFDPYWINGGHAASFVIGGMAAWYNWHSCDLRY